MQENKETTTMTAIIAYRWGGVTSLNWTLNNVAMLEVYRKRVHSVLTCRNLWKFLCQGDLQIMCNNSLRSNLKVGRHSAPPTWRP